MLFTYRLSNVILFYSNYYAKSLQYGVKKKKKKILKLIKYRFNRIKYNAFVRFIS